jgi:CheY-like chemotaxis protein
MSTTVWVKVLGFSDGERHSLKTLFHLSGKNGPQYALWTPESNGPPHVALVDVDSYEAGLELVSPNFNFNLKMICVGAEAPTLAWRTVQRPVDWAAMVAMLDELFVAAPELDIDLDLGEAPPPPLPPGVKRGLLAALPLEGSLYLRARLALAGITSVDEVQTLAQLDDSVLAREYDVVLVHVNFDNVDPWRMVKHLQDLDKPQRTVLAVSSDNSFKTSHLAERMGCAGMLEVPFNPLQVVNYFQKL